MKNNLHNKKEKRYNRGADSKTWKGKPVKIKLKRSADVEPGCIILTCNQADHAYVLNLVQQLNQRVLKIKVFDQRQSILHIAVNDIYYVEVVDTKVFVYDRTNSYEYKGKFRSIYQLLKNFSFIQVSRNTIINTEHIYAIKTLPQCHRELTLENGENIIVNRKYKDDIII